jgi:hypothetical protein
MRTLFIRQVPSDSTVQQFVGPRRWRFDPSCFFIAEVAIPDANILEEDQTFQIVIDYRVSML